jgi:hypothetical protein
MDTRQTQTIPRQADFFRFEAVESSDELTLERLDALLALNAETARQKKMFRTEHEKMQAELMDNPINTSKTFAFFGLMLGLFTPAAIFARYLMDSGVFRNEDSWIIGVLMIVNLVTAVTGYFSGKLIARMVTKTEEFSWALMIVLLPLIGILWGIMAGAAGCAVILIFGAFFGAVFGAMVGSVALPVFGVFHRLLKKGDSIEMKHFLPLAFGITFTICAFVLGL